MPAWGWFAVWLVGMAALVAAANTVVVPRVEARSASTDQRILASLHDAIAPLVTRPVSLTVVERRVTLQGEVSSAEERDRIVAAAAGHDEVADVDGGGLSVAGPLPDALPDVPRDAPDDVPEAPTAPTAPEPDDALVPLAASFAGPDDELPEPPEPSPPAAPAPSADPARLAVRDDYGEELLSDEESLALAGPYPGPPLDAEPDGAPSPDADPAAPAPAGPVPPAPLAPPTAGTEPLPRPASQPVPPPGPAPTSALATGPDPAPSPAPSPASGPDGSDASAPSRPASLSVRVADDALRLVGDVASGDVDRLAAFVEPATEAFDPDYVENTVQAAPDVAPAGWLDPLTRLLIPLAGLDEPSVDIDAERLAVSGTARAPPARDAVLDAAADLFPDHELVDRVALHGGDGDGDGDGGGGARSAAGPVPGAALAGAPTPDDPTARDAAERRTALRTEFEALPDRRILFGSGTAEFADDSGTRIDAIAELLRRHPDVRVEIEGHTDASGPARENLALSQRRANAVRDALVEAGVARDRLVAYGYGEGVPLADNATPEGRARNRRIEFRF